MLYLGGATVAALTIGAFFMQKGPPPLAQSSPTPTHTVSATPSASATPVYCEPDNCPACGMAMRSPRDQDFIQRTQQQRKPDKKT